MSKSTSEYSYELITQNPENIEIIYKDKRKFVNQQGAYTEIYNSNYVANDFHDSIHGAIEAGIFAKFNIEHGGTRTVLNEILIHGIMKGMKLEFSKNYDGDEGLKQLILSHVLPLFLHLNIIDQDKMNELDIIRFKSSSDCFNNVCEISDGVITNEFVNNFFEAHKLSQTVGSRITGDKAKMTNVLNESFRFRINPFEKYLSEEMNTKLVKLSITLDGLISGWCRSRQGIDWNIISEIIKKEFGINIIFDEREFVFQLGERDKLRYQILLRLVSQFSRIDSRVTVSSSEEYTFDYDSKIGDNELSKLVNMSNICQDQILKIRG